jgi:integrase
VYRYQVAGKRRDMGLGSASDLTLAGARDKARDARKQVKDGVDPIDKRRAQRSATTLADAKAMAFKDCAEAYIASHRAGWRNRVHASQWPSTLETYVYPVFGTLPVQAVDVGRVMQALEQNVAGAGAPPTPLWITKPETASRVRGRIEAVLDWASARGYRQGENPARWKGHLENLLTLPSKAKAAARRQTDRQKHHAALPYDELAEFMAELRQQDGIAARALEFAILTAAPHRRSARRNMG